MYSNQLVHKIIFLMFMVQALRKPTKLQRHCCDCCCVLVTLPRRRSCECCDNLSYLPLGIHCSLQLYVMLRIGVKASKDCCNIPVLKNHTFLCMPLFCYCG